MKVAEPHIREPSLFKVELAKKIYEAPRVDQIPF